MKNRIHIFLALLLTFHVTSIFSQSYYALDFVENKGQWEGKFNFKSTVGDGSLFISPSGYRIVKHHPDDHAAALEFIHGRDVEKIKDPVKITTGVKDGDENSSNSSREISIRSHAYSVVFVEANEKALVVPEKPTGEVSNYFLGSNPENWKTDVGSFATVIAKEVYPGVDVKYYSDGDQLKYDFVVQPRANLSRISMRYDGVDKISLRDGQLIIKTSVGESKELAPYAYQIVNGEKIEVTCSYELKDQLVSFRVRGYDKTAVLIIDPVLVFSTYTGSKASNWGFTAAPGPDGSLYAGGIVFGTGYPISNGAFQTSFKGGSSSNGGGVDVGITRFRSDGKTRLFSTYLGGRGNEFPHSIFVDPVGNPVILGRTTSLKDFPVLHDNRIGSLGETDIFITKLSADGRVMLGGVVVGGSRNDGVNIDESMSPDGPKSLLYNYGDNARSEVILDNSNNIYIASSTSSSNFPAGNSAGGRQDGLVMKFSPDLSTQIYSTIVGGTLDDAAFVLSLNPTTNELYVAGATSSLNFPGNKSTAIGKTFAGSVDGFIAILDNNGAVTKSTFLGTSSLDIVYGIQFDEKGFPYVMGISLGSWPVIKAASQSSIYSVPGAKQFISKLQPDLSAYVYSTVYGASAVVPNISPVAFLVDRCENVYVSGWGGKLNLCYSSSFDAKTTGTKGLPLAGNPIQNYTDNKDFYFFVLKKDGTEQLYGSFFGQQGGEGDHVDGGTSRFDKKGAIYQAVCGNCGGSAICGADPISKPMIITPGVVAPVNGALGSRTPGECNLAAFKINFEFDGVKAGIKSIINGISYDTSGCVPLTVDFVDTMELGKKYIFVYNDNTPNDTLESPNVSHVFSQTGLYRVMVVSIDESRCITRDTSYVNIKVGSNRAIIKARIEEELPCGSRMFKFINESEITPGIPFFSTKSFVWDYGHDGQRDTVGVGNVSHTFPAPGSYIVRLYLIDDNYCNQSDYLEFRVYVSAFVKADFETPPTGCIPYTAEFINKSIGGNEFKWFIDGNLFYSGIEPPPYSFGSAIRDDYDIMLVVNDTGVCPRTDTSHIPVSVKPNPTALFSFSPVPPKENTPIVFTNLSSGAETYLWFFGDDLYSNARDTSHIYQTSGTFNACLTAYSKFGCPDVYCENVEALVYPLVNLPNAFTPNGDGVNDVMYVKGYSVKSMMFRIYNRLGQVVFESTSVSYGWDGKFKGVLQPMDSYAYTLSVSYWNGEQVNKKGDITLIR